jgi:hypothetical protein
MQLLKVALVLFLLTGCANTEDVDDSDVIAEGSQAPDDSENEDDSSNSDSTDVVSENTQSATTKPTNKVGAFETKGNGANILYNIASSALQKADNTLSYSIKCTYIIKPLSIKNCMTKTGYLPADAKNKVGKLLLEAKNLGRKKMSANEALVSTLYTCTKGPSPADTKCTLNKNQ